MDFLLALVIVVLAWIIFKSLLVTLLVLVAVAVALSIIRGGSRRL
jgi:hypothetical protein